MTLTIVLDLDMDQFGLTCHSQAAGVAWVLERLKEELGPDTYRGVYTGTVSRKGGPIKDRNGNVCGKWEVKRT